MDKDMAINGLRRSVRRWRLAALSIAGSATALFTIAASQPESKSVPKTVAETLVHIHEQQTQEREVTLRSIGRFQIVVHPLAVKETYLIDTATGDTWTPTEFTEDGRKTFLAWDKMGRIDDMPTEVRRGVERNSEGRLLIDLDDDRQRMKKNEEGRP